MSDFDSDYLDSDDEDLEEDEDDGEDPDFLDDLFDDEDLFEDEEEVSESPESAAIILESPTGRNPLVFRRRL